MKLWVDSCKYAPKGYVLKTSVNSAKSFIIMREFVCRMHYPNIQPFDVIDIGHNAGKYANDGGHYIELLKWFEETGRNYPIHIHSNNQINRLWMQEIIERNGWKEV